MTFNRNDHPHRRYNPLSREWVLVSPHRAKRPWQGQTEATATDERPAYDPKCYLCPRNVRANGETNPDYSSVYFFDNDFSALLPDSPDGGSEDDALFRAKSERGLCRVLCFTPAHNLTLPQLPAERIRLIVDAWEEQYEEIGSRDFIRHVQIFENKGAVMGCSNPHPHGQIWSNESIPLLPAREIESQEDYFAEHHRCLLCDYLDAELKKKERIVVESERFVAVVPFWATWPFETLLLPKSHHASLPELSGEERDDLAAILKALTIRYDNLFLTSFPYSMGIHQAPTDGVRRDGLHMHFHFYPPLLRSAEVRKFMVGYEMLGEPQRDITPETAAERLRDLPGIHYLDGK